MPPQLLKPEAVDLDALASAMPESAALVDIDTLEQQLARLMLERRADVRGYAPGAQYRVGVRLWFGEQAADVVAVRRQYNPQQGSFSVVDLRLSGDDGVRRVVASVAGAPAIAPSVAVDEDAVAALVATAGPALREALLGDARLRPQIDLGVSASIAAAAVSVPRLSLRSSGLFSEGVLVAYLDQAQADQGFPSAAVDVHLSELTNLWSSAREVGRGWGTTETWRLFVAPVLRLLGWSPEPEGSGDQAGPVEPVSQGRGYVLVPDPVSGRGGALQHYASVSGELPRVLVMPQPWMVPVGCSDLVMLEGCPTTELVGTLGVDGVQWGIVTNGRQWRLYCSSQGDPDIGCAAAEYYDVDLTGILDLVRPDEALRATQRHDLTVWWALFGAAGYVATAGRPALTTRLKRASAAYARRITTRLREQLLSAVLPEIAGGFVAYRRERLGVETESDATQRDIMRASLGLVYRLLFVLHAESKFDLPLSHPDYRGQSLTTRLRWSLGQLDQARTLSRSTENTSQYDGLISLFRSLEHGAPRLGLPSYSGGLFSPIDPVVAFIERHRLSDRVVARMLAALGRLDGELVDYTALTARNLSAVAEGLLENSLWIVEAPAGQAALVSTAGMPQAASSSRVPEYVAISVLERALEQVLAARAQDFAAAMDRVAVLRRTLEADLAASGAADVQASVAVAERAACNALLDITVVDPVVGAGVFLVAALDVIVDGVIRILASYHRSHPWVPWSWNPVSCVIQDARTALVADVTAQGLTVDPARLDDGSLLSMLIADRGLYGVDLNASAVAVAQASIEMRGFVVGAPFVSTDTHIRCGDSLAGLWLSEVADLDPTLAATVSDLPEIVSGAVSALGHGRAALDIVAPYETLLDVLFSERYGNRGAYHLVCSLGRKLLDGLRGDVELTEEQVEVVTKATRLRAEYGFVHWETAFPDVFLSPTRVAPERAGFDVVVGSPPADSELGAESMAAGAVAFAAALSSKPQGPFAVLADRLVRVPGGHVAFVLTPH